MLSLDDYDLASLIASPEMLLGGLDTDELAQVIDICAGHKTWEWEYQEKFHAEPLELLGPSGGHMTEDELDEIQSTLKDFARIAKNTVIGHLQRARQVNLGAAHDVAVLSDADALFVMHAAQALAQTVSAVIAIQNLRENPFHQPDSPSGSGTDPSG